MVSTRSNKTGLGAKTDTFAVTADHRSLMEPSPLHSGVARHYCNIFTQSPPFFVVRLLASNSWLVTAATPAGSLCRGRKWRLPGGAWGASREPASAACGVPASQWRRDSQVPRRGNSGAPPLRPPPPRPTPARTRCFRARRSACVAPCVVTAGPRGDRSGAARCPSPRQRSRSLSSQGRSSATSRALRALPRCRTGGPFPCNETNSNQP
jgi:hypothetical protein